MRVDYTDAVVYLQPFDQLFSLLKMLREDRPHVTVPAVVHALKILRHLAKHSSPLGLSSIARALDISPSSCFNLLKTLCAERVVEFDVGSKTYQTGPGSHELVRERQDYEAIARIRPELMNIAAEFGIGSALWRVSEGGRLILVDFASSELATRIHMTVGQRLPVLVGAMGRCIAAHTALTREQLQRALAATRWADCPSLTRYMREVARARTSGWAIDDGDFMRGVTTVAAPILDRSETVRYCIANTFFQGQLDARRLGRVQLAAAACARRMSSALYGRELGLLAGPVAGSSSLRLVGRAASAGRRPISAR